ncbi:bifunctional diguanylate cyclase/phosphodiesterase [Massilia sp. TS11]|uniref:putative bifunctional diguanylate cyclase/phosphodiesterase n=1 Tax=Massilia sp. TS11 TaxID=2908003 RepID=UPI001EDB4679|nr:EAL domain-containing protein [Massilia sp. TS11]MCG2586114.1 EAL domain-containing protein [Massilia sp. TS11]
MSNRVLIVSSNIADNESLESALAYARDGPFECERAGNLADAIARLGRPGIDAVLMDLNLPDSQGLASFDRLHQAAGHTPILTLYTDGTESEAIETIQHGAQAYLMRGFFGNYLVPQALRSIIQRKAVEQGLYVAQARAEITLNSIGDAVVSTDMRGHVDYLNVAAEVMTGWQRDEARGRPIAEVLRILDGETQQAIPNPVEFVLEHDSSIGLRADALLVPRGGAPIPIEDSAAPIHDWDGNIVGAVMVFRDVSHVIALTVQMRHLAQHDFLTNLPNRVLLQDRIKQAIAHARRHGGRLALLFLDLDRFKYINDSLGHAVGDKLLQSVAERLVQCVRTSDTVSRQGGDEFVILLAEDRHAEDAALTADKILAALALPHRIDGHELHASTSIGISIYPDDGQETDTLIKNADTAMYHAKERGRNNYQFFREDMNTRAVERQLIESSLRRALERQEFELFYQPKINLSTGHIAGVEALLRWHHPDWGLVAPQRFITVAEESGLIVPIGRWVLRAACDQAARWHHAGLAPLTVAVNVSALEFQHREFLDGVRDILAVSGADPRQLQVELTESVLMRDVGMSTDLLLTLKHWGLQIAVDDFGTGYSSLSYLNRLPIDVLKIDQSFVHAIGSAAENNGAIVSAVIGMGKNLHQRVVAEGVEMPEQLAFLQAQACDEAQGFLFSPAVTADALGPLLGNLNAG